MQLKKCKDNLTGGNPVCKIKPMEFISCYKTFCISRLVFLRYEYNYSFIDFSEEAEGQ